MADVLAHPLLADYPIKRLLLGGERWAAINTLTLGQARIIVGRVDDMEIETGYMYATDLECGLAWGRWLMRGGDEPSGWLRATDGKRTRRRPDGDPEKEYEAL